MKECFFVVLFFFTLFFGCGKVKADRSPRLIKASSKVQPEWILKKRKADENYYFVGIGQKSSDFQKARKSAIDDGVSRVVEYIGFRATTHFKSVKERKDVNEVESFKEEIIQSIEGRSSARVVSEIEDSYYEEYTDGIVFYLLIKSPVKWVENERKRLKRLVEEQREQAMSLIAESRKLFEKGEVVSSLNNVLLALEISERAEENSDVYSESKDLILLILSSLRFSLLSKAEAFYKEGGSDEIVLQVTTTKNSIPIKGLMIETSVKDNLALLTTKSGFQTDAAGKVFFTVDSLKETEELNLFFSFSMKRFEAIKEYDVDFYENIKKGKEIKFNLFNKFELNMRLIRLKEL